MPNASSTAGRRYGGQTEDERRTDRRRRLLDAALEIFGTSGYQTSTITNICSTAGVSTRNFYDEFPDKESLLVALHDDVNERALVATVDALAASGSTDLEERARTGFQAYLDVFVTDPRWARIAFVEAVGATPATYAHRQAALDRFTELVRAEADALAAQGLVPARDRRFTARAIVGALTALVEAWGTPDGPTVDDVVDEATRVVVSVLTA